MRVIRARGYVYSDWHVDGDWHLLQIDNAMINHNFFLVFKPFFLIFKSAVAVFYYKTQVDDVMTIDHCFCIVLKTLQFPSFIVRVLCQSYGNDERLT